MAASKKKKSKPSAPKKPWAPPEVQGLLTLGCALVFMLSLLSFGWGHYQTNWLGAIGSAIGRTGHVFFGLSSYLIPLFIGWIGWRLTFNKPLNHVGQRAFYVLICMISVSMLLTLLEVHYPAAGQALRQWFYPAQTARRMFFHLGGAPFFYFYHDLPGFNFITIFNALGAALIFSCTLLASLLFLFKITPQQILAWIVSWIPEKKEVQEEKVAPPSRPVKETKPPKININTPKPFKEHEEEPTQKDESDFMRYVKLRIPDTGVSLPSSDSREHHQNDLLAIQPDLQTSVRPSISRKASLPEIKEKEPKETKEQTFIQPPLPLPPPPAPIAKPKSEHPTPKKAPPQQQSQQTSVPQSDYTNYHLPDANMLTNAKKVDQTSLKQNLRRQAEVLEETLMSFGIEAKVGQINCGPTITSFEVHPAIGVKVQKIKTLENDIALNMEAKSIRIIAPIPGKAAVGIEVPNPQPQEVSFKEMLMAYQQGPNKLRIPVLLGKAVNGDYVMSDLTKMPHCIIAGATGSGKSVCINTIVMSILLNAKPDEIRLVMVDPKKVELTPYSKLPHMLAPVITEPQGACAALKWLVREMENRYELLKLLGVRNIDGFNNRTINKELEESLDRPVPLKLPYIVGIIDELADLMMVANNDIETPIARIAQMARAVGIHLILATQRPSREVITGLIKANFPTRISFKVASRVNSQIVLDEIGAESLLGNGDMLFLPPGASTLLRAQGAFIRDEDINAVVKSICDQASPNYVISSFDNMPDEGGEDGFDDDMEEDSLYEEAKEVILNTGNASTTFLQRKLKIGYARAASIIDQLERRGVVGPGEGAKPRKILISRKGLDDTADDLDVALTEDGG